MQQLSFLQDYQPYGDFSVNSVWVYWPGSSTKTNKGVVYTLMGGSPTTRVMVYA